MPNRRVTAITAVAVGICTVGAISFAAVSQAATVHARVYHYGSHSKQWLDAIWTTPKQGTQPGVVIVHGGYWDGGSRINWRSTARWYAAQGFAVFSYDHRLTSDAPWPAQRDDSLAALAWIKKNAKTFRVDTDRIAVIGSQAGGQLAAQLGTYGNGGARVRGVLALSPIVSPQLAYDSAQTNAATWTRRKLRNQTVLLANCTPTYKDATCAARYRDADPTSHVRKDDAPMWLVHSKGDVIPVDHSNALRTALTKAGQKDVYLSLVGGSGTGGDLLTSKTKVLSWLRAHTKPRSAKAKATSLSAPAGPSVSVPVKAPAVKSLDNGTKTSNSPTAVPDNGAASIPSTKSDPLPPLTEQRDVAYGAHARHHLDAYFRPSSTPQPAVIAVHGGYWYEGDKSSMASRSRWLADNGFAVFAPNYRFNTQAAWSAQRADIQAVIAWVKSRAATYNVDPNRIVLLGSSAGGHLVTSLAVNGTGTQTVKAVAALSPVANPYLAYTDGELPTADQARRKLRDTAVLLTRCTPDKNDKTCWNRWVDAVDYNHASPGDAPMLLIHSEGDFVPPSHANELCTRTTPHNVSCTVHTIPGSSHGLSVINAPETSDMLLNWLKSHV